MQEGVSTEKRLEEVAETEAFTASILRIESCREKLDMAIAALWEVRGLYRADISCLNSYVKTAYSAIATIQRELQRYKDRILEEALSHDGRWKNTGQL